LANGNYKMKPCSSQPRSQHLAPSLAS
jgi:hypothetical protein